jgi:hypothetical protein
MSWRHSAVVRMTPLLMVGALVLFSIGGLVGATWTTQVLAGVSRRHAAERRSLNHGWRALENARRTRGDSVHCARCHQRLAESSWMLVGLPTEEDDLR